MMSPITAPKLRLPSTEDGECSLSDSDDEIAIPPSKLRLQKKAPGLVKSISESAIGTPIQTSRLRPSGNSKRTANVLTPRGNERKKQRSKENPQDEKKRGRPPKTRIGTAGSRATSSTRSSSRSPRAFTKAKSMFDLKVSRSFIIKCTKVMFSPICSKKHNQSHLCSIHQRSNLSPKNALK